MSGAEISRLEFAVVRAGLETRTRTPLGARETQRLAPHAHLAEARARIEAIRQMRMLIDRLEEPPIGGAQDVAIPLNMGEKGMMLEGPALRAIADTMRAASDLRSHLLDHETTAPSLYGMAASIKDLRRMAESVSRSFGPDGLLADDASPELGPLRRRVRSLREMIQDQVTTLLGSEKIAPYLQETYFTIRGDRYVLPIKASYKNDVQGIVHDASGSGQTVFIEPHALVDLGNRIKIAQSEEVEEEHRILTELTQLVVGEASGIREMMRVIGLIDLIQACAHLAIDLACVAISPSEEPGFDLIRARHPLLALQVTRASGDAPTEAPREIVANDLGLKSGQHVLVLTGPNTGGKTVAMKTIGLLALMVKCGLHLPCAEGSRMGWFDRIEVAIGDQQSIASHLSTFAAHLKEIADVVKIAGTRTLVLIDEITADTEPTQGQALAQAILERLADRSAHAVVTTHYERLKTVPFVDARFRNAGVGFDPTRLRPTYQVMLDLPQGSSGIDIAQTLGLQPEIIERAKKLMGEGTRAIDDLMRELQTRSIELDRATKAAEEARRDAARLEVDLRARLSDAERERRRAMEIVRVELVGEIEGARSEVRQIVAALQSAAEHESARDAMRKATEASQRVHQIEAIEREKLEKLSASLNPKETPLRDVKVGDWVHVEKLGRDGDVVALEGKDAHVAVGNLRMRVLLTDLFTAKGSRPKTRASARPEPQRSEEPRHMQAHNAVHAQAHGQAHTHTLSDVRAQPVGSPAVTEELDLRGHTIDESIERLEAFLDHHFGGPMTHVRIIHGHGTGALRSALRAHLRSSGYVKSIRPGGDHEGGDGATVVELS